MPFPTEVTPEVLSDVLTALWHDVAARASAGGWPGLLLPQDPAAALEGLEDGDREAMKELLQESRQILAGRQFEHALRACSRAMLADTTARAIESVFGIDPVTAKPVLFAKAVPSIATAIRPLMEEPFDRATGYLSALEEPRRLMLDLWQA